MVIKAPTPLRNSHHASYKAIHIVGPMLSYSIVLLTMYVCTLQLSYTIEYSKIESKAPECILSGTS